MVNQGRSCSYKKTSVVETAPIYWRTGAYSRQAFSQ